MKDLLQKSNFAIVGAGKRGKRFLEFFLRPDLGELNIRIVGVADTNPAAEGMVLAEEKGIYATADFRDLYQLQDLNCIIELTGDLQVAGFIERSKPKHIRLIDYQEAEFLLEFLKIEEITRKHTRLLGDHMVLIDDKGGNQESFL